MLHQSLVNNIKPFIVCLYSVRRIHTSYSSSLSLSSSSFSQDGQTHGDAERDAGEEFW